jgi:hypothetical protein
MPERRGGCDVPHVCFGPLKLLLRDPGKAFPVSKGPYTKDPSIHQFWPVQALVNVLVVARFWLDDPLVSVPEDVVMGKSLVRVPSRAIFSGGFDRKRAVELVV